MLRLQNNENSVDCACVGVLVDLAVTFGYSHFSWGVWGFLFEGNI